METEYATLILPCEGSDSIEPPSGDIVYESLCDAIARPTTGSGVFDGTAFSPMEQPSTWISPHDTEKPGGFLEIATPEVHARKVLPASRRSSGD